MKPHSFNSRLLKLGVSEAKWSTDFPWSHHHLGGVVFLPCHYSPTPKSVYEAIILRCTLAHSFKLVLLADTTLKCRLRQSHQNSNLPLNCMGPQPETKEYSKRCLIITSFTPYKT